MKQKVIVNNYSKSWKTVDKEFKSDKDIGRQLKKSIKLEDFLNDTVINEKDDKKTCKYTPKTE